MLKQNFPFSLVNAKEIILAVFFVKDTLNSLYTLGTVATFSKKLYCYPRIKTELDILVYDQQQCSQSIHQ